MTPPPALQRKGTPWSVALRKENNTFRLVFQENTINTPEEAGEPMMILFAPKAIVRFRSTAPDGKER
jgi:hypothetical protein